MPKKPRKWGIKVWLLGDSFSRYNYFFEICCSKNSEVQAEQNLQHRDEGNFACGIVMLLHSGLDGKDQVVVTNNYFSSVELFTKLASIKTYATSTIHAN